MTFHALDSEIRMVDILWHSFNLLPFRAILGAHFRKYYSMREGIPCSQDGRADSLNKKLWVS